MTSLSYSGGYPYPVEEKRIIIFNDDQRGKKEDHVLQPPALEMILLSAAMFSLIKPYDTKANL